ncbi:cation efflux family-domain-containing protein [Lophiotrema nucula]|uniref:Cation efflux family-domain-containing protein n=1 Tax=Lophiotrema nucula TaxID=690887 RepID=A0A6A5Z6X2_9PLEO|nr:cation efflux family-domain-containing protein [Lophiotrema nucula]
MTDRELVSGSPGRGSLPRIPSLKAFLPLSAETISTRGQNLPALLKHSRSSGNALPRRPSTLRSNSRERRGSVSSGDDDLESFRHGLTMSWANSDKEREERRISLAAQILNTPQMRSQRLIGNSNPRYRWEKYFKTDEELKGMAKPTRQYYERNNYLVQNYLYIDRLLDSSLPHNLIQEYGNPNLNLNIPTTITEESSNATSPGPATPGGRSMDGTPPTSATTQASNGSSQVKVKRTPKNLYKVPEADENTPLLEDDTDDPESQAHNMPEWVPDEDEGTESPIVKLAIYINLAANTALLIMKIIVTIMTSSLSVIASLVDAALDFLSTAIVWFTSWMIARQDQYSYPVGRRRLEPIGVLVFSVIMITSFFQVGIEGINRMTGKDHTVVQLTIPAVAIMSSTVVIKFLCWLWCRLIRNSSVQALAQDAITDVVFNIFSIIFPLIGYFAKVWWLDPLGGILLSLYVILNWSRTSTTHIRNLTGAAASADERNILLYLTMRFAKTIKHIQGLQAYHAGDKLNVEVDIVLDEGMSLRDSHDLGESLQYVLESVPYVDRAFVHMDYAAYNLPTHMSQQD